MAKAYYSTVFSQSADDAVGAVRNILYNGRRIRQSLLALSDPDRAMTYGFCDAPAFALRRLFRC
jgi:hypothetical protein